MWGLSWVEGMVSAKGRANDLLKYKDTWWRTGNGGG